MPKSKNLETMKGLKARLDVSEAKYAEAQTEINNLRLHKSKYSEIQIKDLNARLAVSEAKYTDA